MIIERCLDTEIIKKVFKTPGVWECISNGEDPDSLDIPMNDNLYLVAYNKGDPIGILFVHPTSIGLWQCHVQVVPKYRKDHAEWFGRESLEWVWANTTIDKMIALIPECYPNVKAFAELQSFKLEGFIKNSTIKNGELMGQFLMGIER